MKIENAESRHISKIGVDPYQFIEKIGRTCYKSEELITEDSAKKFVAGLFSRHHLAMIEHYWVHFHFTTASFYGRFTRALDEMNFLLESTNMHNIYKFVEVHSFLGETFVSCPLRVFVEVLECATGELHKDVKDLLSQFVVRFPEVFENWNYERVVTDSFYKVFDSEKDMVDFIYDLAETHGVENFTLLNKVLLHHVTHTFWFKCDRGVSHEIVRHRVASFAQESTRYCNYSKDKFGNEITVINPSTVLFLDGNCDQDYQRQLWRESCEFAEKQYFELVKAGATPQEARSVLPNSLKTEIIVTANEAEWQHIVNLRVLGTTGKPHPQMVEVMTPVYEQLKTISNGRVK